MFPKLLSSNEGKNLYITSAFRVGDIPIVKVNDLSVFKVDDSYIASISSKVPYLAKSGDLRAMLCELYGKSRTAQVAH